MQVLYRFLLIFLIFIVGCDSNNPEDPSSFFQIQRVETNGKILDPSKQSTDIDVKGPIVIVFNLSFDISTVTNSIKISDSQGTIVPYQYQFHENNTVVSLSLENDLDYAADYTLLISDQLKGANGEQFKGAEFEFTTINGSLKLDSLKINGAYFPTNQPLDNVDLDIEIEAFFSEPLQKVD